MKAKKLMGMIACAGACVSLSSFANTTNGWFGVSVNDTTVNAGACTVKTNNVDVASTETSGKIVLDNDLDSALTITPGSGATLSDGLVTITSTAVLTPSDASELGAVTGGAQAGFAVAVAGNETNFYGYASAGGAGGEPDWIQFTTGPADPEADTTFTIAINYRDKKVSFYNGTTLLVDAESHSEFSISNEFVNLSNVAAYGSGSISSITSQYEVAVAAATVNDVTKKYGSGAEAVKAAGASGTVQDIDSNGDAAPTPQAANGLYAWQCDVLGVAKDAKDAKIPFKPAATVNGSITLQIASEIEEGLAATFKVSGDNGATWSESYPSGAIQIPQAQGKYLIKPDQITVAQ